MSTHARQSRRPLQSPALTAGFALLIAAGALSGCTRFHASDPALLEPSGAVVPSAAVAPRALHIFEGSTGRSLGWADVMAAASWADAVFIGERHGDPIAHRLQLALFEDLAAGYAGTALALEHLERHEQHLVDGYLRGEVALDRFIDDTKSRDWAGKDTWVSCYQPLVDAARESGSPVVAANAPRDFVRRARTEGFDALAALPEPERAQFDIPIEGGGLFDRSWDDRWSAYRVRFDEIMSSAEDRDDPEVRARLTDVFRSQSTWDATMGASMARALEGGAPKVVLCAGCFHVERDGGTVLQFEARAPRARVLTITVVDRSSDRLAAEDRGLADIVVYGAPVARAKPAETAEPAQSATPAEPAEPAQTSAAAPREAGTPAGDSEDAGFAPNDSCRNR
jgi:uncharacterized iron-regulated protein